MRSYAGRLIVKNIFYTFLTICYCSYQIEASGFLKPILAEHKDSETEEKLYNKWFAAIRENNLEIVKKIAEKVDINRADKLDGKTALIIASKKNYESIVKFLLSIPEINVNTLDSFHRTALMRACQSGHETIVKILLNISGMDVNAKDKLGATAFIHAIDNDFINIKLFFQVPGFSLKPHETLIWAAKHGYAKVIKYLLRESLINVNYQDNAGRTGLMYAAINCHADLIKLFLEIPDIDVNIQDIHGKTALIHAIPYQRCIRVLLGANEININTRDQAGQNALMIVSDKKPLFSFINQNIINMIQEKLNELTNNAISAIKSHNLELLKKLILQIGVDGIFDANGNTLLDHAFSINCPEIIIYLLQNSKDPQELLSRFPFESISPSSQVFELMLDLAYDRSKSTASTHVASEQPQKAICQVCTSKTDKLCSKCKKVYYCCAACQKADWKNHKQSCN